MQMWALMADTFRQSRDRRIFWLMLLISMATAGAMACVAFEPGKVNVLFGFWEIKTDLFTSASQIRADVIASVVVDFIMDLVLGWLGVILSIIATAGFIPGMMERGGIEVLASKPLKRWKLFLGKYLGSMGFWSFQAVVFVGLTFLVVGFRWGIWLPGYLWTIPLVVLLFSYLYCVSALAAVLFRGTVTVVLITLGAWVAFVGIQNLDDAFVMFPSWTENQRIYHFVGALRWAVPKTQDITYVARGLAGAAPSKDVVPQPDASEEGMLRLAGKVEAKRMAISPVYTIGSSLVFEAVMLLLATWRFSRRDF